MVLIIAPTTMQTIEYFGFPCSVKHIVDIQVNGVVNPAVHFLEQSVLFDVLAIAGIKVIQIAVEDTGISKGFLHVRSAFLALNHNKEMCIWQ